MTWVRFDDQASIHRKVAPLDDATYRLWHEAIEWSSRNLTDGLIPADEFREVSKRATQPRATRLVERRLWHVAGAECDSPKCPTGGPTGWVIHDYFEYQPSRVKVKADQAAKAERQRRWIEAKKGGPKDASQDVSKDNPPSPPRPAPKEGGAGAPQSLPAADVGGAAASAKRESVSSPCPTCANPVNSAYHRNSCRGEAA